VVSNTNLKNRQYEINQIDLYIADFPLQSDFYKEIQAKAILNYSESNSAGYVDSGITYTILKKTTNFLIEGYNRTFTNSIVFRNHLIICTGKKQLMVYSLKGKFVLK
jgi:uncharacterized membrane protein YkgB